jgi:hypothetical protein
MKKNIAIQRIKQAASMGKCPNVERENRFGSVGRYYCDMIKGHTLPCSCWSISSSGRASLSDPVHPNDAN